MKKILAALLLFVSGFAAAQVSVTINGQIAPGVYGQVTFGDRVPAPYVYGAPVLIARPPVAVPPVYLHVPIDHRRNWGHWCRQYDACGRPVYFVREDWMREHYHPGHGKKKHKHKHKHEHKHD